LKDLYRDLRTARAILRRFGEDDAEELLHIFRDPSVRQNLLDDELVSREWVLQEVESSDSRFVETGAGLWSARILDSPEIVGFVGFREFFDPPQLQLLYGLMPEYWNRGLATEIAQRVCDHAFHNLGFSRIEAAVDIPNERSAAVLQRLGMKLFRTTKDGPGGTAFYSVER